MLRRRWRCQRWGSADEAAHFPFVEDIAHKAVVFVQEKAPVFVAGGDTGGILPTVLQDGEGVIKRLVDVVFADDSDDAAHGVPLG